MQGSTAKAVHDNATVSTPVVGDAGATTGPAAGFASFAAAASPFKQLSEDSIVTADNAGGATPCSQESVFTPPTAQTVAPCPSAPLRKSGTRTFESPPSSVKNAMNSGMTDFGGSSAFKQLAEGGASIFATSQRNAHGFGSPAVFENGVNGGGPKSTPQAWSMSTPSAWDKAKQEVFVEQWESLENQTDQFKLQSGSPSKVIPTNCKGWIPFSIIFSSIEAY